MLTQLCRIGVAAAFLATPMVATADAPPKTDGKVEPKIEIFAPEHCLTCVDYALHLTENGLPAAVSKTADMDTVKRRLKVPQALESVPTGVVGGYFIEGHVPADDIKQLLLERPKARGLAVPGLPQGAPGRDAPDPSCERGCIVLDDASEIRPSRRERFNTLLVAPDGKTSIWARH